MRLQAITNYELRITNLKSKIVNRKSQILLLLPAYCLLFTACCLLFAVSAHADPPKTKGEVVKKEKQLESLKREIVEKRKSLEYNVKKENNILEELERLDKARFKKEEELADIEDNIVKLKGKRNVVDARITTLVSESERLAGFLNQRLVAMYKMNKGGIMQSLVSSNSVNDFGRRYKYINKIVEYDVDLLRDYKENQSFLEAERERLKVFQEEVFSLKHEVEHKKGEIKEEKDKKQAILTAIKKKKNIQLAAIREMEGASKELQSFLDKFKKDMAENALGNHTFGFAAMRGGLPMPVAGKIISMYGKVEHPKFRTITFNNGIEIAANIGTEVRSVYKGKVAYSGWFRGYGKVMIIDHGDGYFTLLARLSKIIKDVDSSVGKGDIVALVGDTGSTKGPHLYFEVRQKGVPLDPLNWLAYTEAKK
ncbi:MAG: peptidoglycan DD-metalloendopeptidase family protein [Deltaproteobacteria bacterium]|nr:peptidoglycan DD-metalloendopeptidase family protein [Deltaproteobacteria bacterium]